jgi:hypothetical protein
MLRVLGSTPRCPTIFAFLLDILASAADIVVKRLWRVQMPMEFSEASRVQLTFGKHVGRTLDNIAIEDSGLKYLDWLRGDMAKTPQHGSRARIFEALEIYLEDKSIKKELRRIL